MLRQAAKSDGVDTPVGDVFKRPDVRDSWRGTLVSKLLDRADRLQLSKVSIAANKATVQHTPEFIVRLDLQDSNMSPPAHYRRLAAVSRRIRSRGQLGTTLVLAHCTEDDSNLYSILSALTGVGEYVNTLHLQCPTISAAFLTDAASTFPQLQHLVLGCPDGAVRLHSVSLPPPSDLPNLTHITILHCQDSQAAEQALSAIQPYLQQLTTLELADNTHHLPDPSANGTTCLVSALPSIFSAPTPTLTQLHLPHYDLDDNLCQTLLHGAPALQDITVNEVHLEQTHTAACAWRQLRTTYTTGQAQDLVKLPPSQDPAGLTVELYSTHSRAAPRLLLSIDNTPASAQQLLHRLQHDLRVSGCEMVCVAFNPDLQPQDYLTAIQHYTPVLAALWQPTFTLVVDRSTPAILQAVLPVVSQLGIVMLSVQGDTEPPAADSNLNLPVTLLHLNDAVLEDSWVRFLLQHAPALQHVLAPEVAVTSSEFATQHCPWTQLSVMQLECSQLLQLPGPATGQPLEVTCKVFVCDCVLCAACVRHSMVCKGVQRLQQRVRVTVMDEDTDVVESAAEFRDQMCIKVVCPDDTPPELQPAVLRADLQLAALTAPPTHDHRLVMLAGWTFTPAVMRELKYLPQWAAPAPTTTAAETQAAVQPLPDGSVPVMLEFTNIQWPAAGEFGPLPLLVPPCYTRWLFSTDTAADSTQAPEAAVQAICAAACVQRSTQYPLRLVVQGEQLGWLESVEESIRQWGADEYVVVECDGGDVEEGGDGSAGEDGKEN